MGWQLENTLFLEMITAHLLSPSMLTLDKCTSSVINLLHVLICYMIMAVY